MKELKIVNFKSLPKNNFFAPEWSYYICESITKNINCKSLAKFLLKQEKEILKLEPTLNDSKTSYADGYTGLGFNSVTSRFGRFNVFNFKNKHISNLKKQIIETHKHFLKSLNVSLPKELYIQCWYNVMRKGEKINAHIHSYDPDCYLGGHFCVQANETSTYYINPVNQIHNSETYKSKNKEGTLTLFQNCVPHYTDRNESNSERITIAFDLSYHKLKNHYIKLY
jgi:hypothetical protein